MKNYLLTPGPTPVPEKVNLTLAEPMIHHRTPAFAKIFEETINGLKYIFQTENDIILFAASGTGAMQASVVNFLSSKDKALVVRGGKFGERFEDICSKYAVETVSIDVEWGHAVEVSVIEKKLKEDSSIKAVFTTLCETSTGVLTDIESIARIVKSTDAILVVDAVSGLGACDLKTDLWDIDVVVSASQKGLMTPPGLSFMSVSKKAWEKAEKSDLPEFYFDALVARKNLAKLNTPWTSSVNLIKGLNTAIGMIKEEGLENSLKKYAKLAEATREAVKALGLKLFADNPANAVTAVESPKGIDAQQIVKIMRDELGVAVAGGQAQLKGKIFRIAHMGYIEKFDIITAISALEMALCKLNYSFNLGAGVKAAEKILSK